MAGNTIGGRTSPLLCPRYDEMRRLKRVGFMFYFGCLSGYDVFFNGSQTLLQRVKQCCIASTHFIASYTVTHFVGVKCCAASESVALLSM